MEHKWQKIQRFVHSAGWSGSVPRCVPHQMEFEKLKEITTSQWDAAVQEKMSTGLG